MGYKPQTRSSPIHSSHHPCHNFGHCLSLPVIHIKAAGRDILPAAAGGLHSIAVGTCRPCLIQTNTSKPAESPCVRTTPLFCALQPFGILLGMAVVLVSGML
jgi:hypothetical protein